MTDQIREKLRSMIADEYQVNFLADGLPAATRFRVQNKDTNDGEDYTMTLPNGFPLGVEKDGQYYLYNHVRIWMQYHTEALSSRGRASSVSRLSRCRSPS